MLAPQDSKQMVPPVERARAEGVRVVILDSNLDKKTLRKNPDLIDKYVAITNRVLKDAPQGMRIGMHLCRGNRGGQWHSEGSYDDVAERLFNARNIQFYFLEYDTPRAGTFTPLRLVPPHKTVVLGIVSTKTPKMESKDALKERIEDAARQLDLNRLGVSPQCGFASIDTGNPITPDVQEKKLGLVVELARDIWGDA